MRRCPWKLVEKITEAELSLTSHVWSRFGGNLPCSLTHVGLLWTPPSPAGEDLKSSPGDAAKTTPFPFVGRKLSSP